MLAGLMDIDAALQHAVVPSALTGLIGWWDASVFASLSLTGPVVNSITDQSGASHDLTGISSPTYGATAFNNRPGITLALASVQYLANTSFPLATGSTLTAWAVLKRNGGSDYSRYISYTASGASHDYDNNGSFTLCRNFNGDGLLFANNARSTTSSGTAFAVGDYRRLIVTVKSDGTETIYVNGTATSSAQSVTNWVSPGYLAFGGSQFEAASLVKSDLVFAESGIATGFTDATNVAGLDLYLKNKWGL